MKVERPKPRTDAEISAAVDSYAGRVLIEYQMNANAMRTTWGKLPLFEDIECLKHALVCHPFDAALSREMRVLIITNAYESGFGQAHRTDVCNPHRQQSEEWEAYKQGRELAEERLSGTRAATIRAMNIVGDERRRQVEEEGFDATRDDAYTMHELPDAAAAYATYDPQYPLRPGSVPPSWPFNWDNHWWKPGDASREDAIKRLAKAGALIIAEIERLHRQENNNG